MQRSRVGLALIVVLIIASVASAKTVQVTAAGTSFTPSTVTINTGDSIKWVWGSGIHTTTSGTGSSDPQAGLLWNAPLDLTHTSFTRRFTSSGNFPFFCQYHEVYGMKGTITVNNVMTDVFGDEGDGSPLPQEILNQNVPNPFNAETLIPFTLRSDRSASIVIYNILGRSVRTLLSGPQRAGTYETPWDGRDSRGQAVATGVYFYRLIVDGEAPLTRKMVVLR